MQTEPKPEPATKRRIEIRKSSGAWVVRANGAVIAETRAALELLEGDHDGVIYFPRGDIAMTLLERTDTSTICPFKGQASYYAVHGESAVIEDAAWSYETPIEAVAEIAGHLAFYPDKVTIEQL